MIKSLALLPLLALIASATDLPRGANPANASLYVAKGGKFTCFDKSRTIPFSAVNDDYCDCPDGSDEPGTAACLDTYFFCHNKGHIPGTIPTSRVNDGICDPECCDGSDEYEGKVTCPNVCKSVGEEYRAQQAELARQRKEGLRLKNQYRIDAAKVKADSVEELAAVESQLAPLLNELTDLRAKRDAAEAEERRAQDYENKLGKFSPRSLAARVTRLQGALEKIEVAMSVYRDSNQDHESRTKLEEGYNNARSALQSDDLVTLGEVPSAADVDDLMPQSSFMDRARYLMYGILKPGSLSPVDIAKKSAETARQAVWDIESKVRDLESKRDALQTALKVDVGSETAWGALVGKCYSTTLGEYSYEVCPFKGAEQKPVGHSVGHSLGKWGKWVDNGSAWQLDNGAKCWSGPIRNVKVTLQCGDKEEVKDIAEPVMCEYTMTFITPAACKEEESDDKVDMAFNHQEL